MPATPSNLLGTHVGRAEALETVLDTIIPMLSPDQKEALATAITAITLSPPENTQQNWLYDPEYSVAMEGVYKTLLVELWRG